MATRPHAREGEPDSHTGSSDKGLDGVCLAPDHSNPHF